MVKRISILLLCAVIPFYVAVSAHAESSITEPTAIQSNNLYWQEVAKAAEI